MKFFSIENELYPEIDDCVLRLLVPTLNRPKACISNIKYLDRVLKDCPFSLQIICSENGADEKLFVDHEEFSGLENVIFLKRKNRLSLGEHMHWLSSLGGAKWHLWCGDDDILDPNYLWWVTENLESLFDQGVRPISQSTTESEYFSQLQRLAYTKKKLEFPAVQIVEENELPNYNRTVVLCATQLSGILLRSEVENEVYSEGGMQEDNIYPWVGFFTHALNRGSVKLLKNVPSLITDDTRKLFTYNNNGLLNDLVDAVLAGNYRAGSSRRAFARQVLSARNCHWRLFKTNPSLFISLLNYRFVISSARGWRFLAITCFPSIFRTFLKYLVDKLYSRFSLSGQYLKIFQRE